MQIQIPTRSKGSKTTPIFAVKYKPYRSLDNYKKKKQKQTQGTVRRIKNLKSNADIVDVPGFALLIRWSIAQG